MSERYSAYFQTFRNINIRDRGEQKIRTHEKELNNKWVLSKNKLIPQPDKEIQAIR
jgi:hypothetical protein